MLFLTIGIAIHSQASFCFFSKLLMPQAEKQYSILNLSKETIDGEQNGHNFNQATGT
jgi:hypothetical protein